MAFNRIPPREYTYTALRYLTCCTSTLCPVQPWPSSLQSLRMRLRWGLYLAILVAPVISATTIDLSSETSILVHTGDTLIFQVSTGSFGVNAAAFGLPLYPEDVSFAL